MVERLGLRQDARRARGSMPLENSKWLPSIDTGGVDLAGEAQEVTRSWYLTAEVADQLQAAANNLYHELRGRAPKHVVLEALLRAGIDQPDRGADRAALEVALAMMMDPNPRPDAPSWPDGYRPAVRGRW